MSIDDLWRAVGRAQLDPDFAAAIRTGAGAAAGNAGYVLETDELNALAAVTPLSVSDEEEFAFQRKIARDQLSVQFERGKDLSKYTVQILKDTLGTARQTYRAIKWMTISLFIVGLSLFVAAAVVSVVTNEAKDALVFGGLGSATFVALFITGPMDKSQDALSNLVQAEILFMNFFEQITFWENYALMPEGIPPVPNKANIERASVALQERTTQASQLLQKFVENPKPS